jgi:hypothetical protein
MPKLPTNMKKARAAVSRSRADREHQTQADAESRRAEECALTKMRRDFAREHGVPESEVSMIVCRRGRR